MTGPQYISSRERYLLAGIAGLLLLVVLFSIGIEAVQDYNYWVYREQAKLSGRPMIDFGSPGIKTPLFHLLSVAVFLTVLFGKKFYFATLATVFYLSTLAYSVNWRFHSLDVFDVSTSSLWDSVVVLLDWIVRPIDLIALFVLIPVLLWEVSVLVRLIRLKSKRLHTELP